MPDTITTAALFSFFLVFCRMGSAFMLMPGVGEMYIPIRIRLVAALFTSLALVPVLKLPDMPDSLLMLALLLTGELLVGVALGLTARIIISTMHTTGMVIAYQAGLSSALLFDANQGGQGSILGNFITLFAMLLFFATNMHLLLLSGYAESYILFPPGHLPPIGDFSELISRFVSESFLVAIKIAAPQIVIGLLLFLGSGVLARLMPSIQIFFVILPLQILISFLVLGLTFSAGMLWFIQYFEETMTQFLFPG